MHHSSHHFPFDPSKITSMNYSKAVGNGAKDMLTRSDNYNDASSDASLFSSSLPVFPHEKLISNNQENDLQSLEDNGLLEDLANHAIGNLLPDEDDLLAGVIDGIDVNALTNRADELEEYDLFGSGGGMELESDMDNLNLGISKVSLGDGVVGNGLAHFSLTNGVGTVAGEHPYGEHPSRTLFVRNINSNVEDSELRALFEQHGDIRTLYTACKHRGFVMISYYDIRAARTAMRALQNKPLRRRKLDIHYSIPKDNPSDKDINQGTLVVFNLDPSVSCEDLLHIFGAYGEVKEIRETPHKRHHKFIEYYDVRAAEAALRSLNRSDIAGKRIKLEPSRPGGARRNLMLQMTQEFDQDDTRSFRLQVGPSIASSPPGVWPQFGSPIEHSPLQSLSKSPVLGSMSSSFGNGLPGLASILHPQPARIAPIGLGPTIAESMSERGRNRRVDQNGSQIDSKKQFQLDLDKITSGEDTRTTLMIKNIPNKYTSKMLLAAIDENHSGTYDFLYLPIDFKNKCNVGYAFINMLSPTHIIPFYQAFNGKKWEKFNSEKVASLAYARIQGKMALVTHFQNSSLMNEDKRCRPILFHLEGSEAVDQEPLSSSSLNIQMHRSNGSDSGDSSGSPPKTGVGSGAIDRS
ncbi:putative RNA recognition motif domain, mei2-like RNA recognition, RNA-binding domain superfamily [Helianthus annuus]|nr:putative RNA recognition motif domain, mei2-like RNA recognition, RNA-binding domain superfamily [Helianthus annuus]KAJ0455772.1 putative RNA recognition motif domain, mei2/Mei2-like RNA recognition [Helianthus annuus]KAJ0473167.1 putative RNA recognition motif domain, mei2-like RNA recognition, RNA-binding domain superfamily [Helianthus annuus]KAJ0648768.1 putative RNA recognition motif domain, mei2-like RNA recognition, RNA-binding domain superfamily [Helianthus annuus]KAJ0693302.1 putativ